MQNDYTFPAASSGLGQKQFKIYHSISDNKYYIQDLGNGSGTFVRIDTKVPIAEGNVFAFGSFHIALLYKQAGDTESTISVQVYHDSQAKEQM